VATFGDLRRYLDRAGGWVYEPNLVRGRKKTGDHQRYFKEMPDGSRRRTKVSGHPNEEIGRDLFSHILKDQIGISEADFWAVLSGREDPPPAVETGRSPSSPGIPAWLLTALVDVAKIPEDEVLSMTPEEARQAWEAFRSRPRP